MGKVRSNRDGVVMGASVQGVTIYALAGVDASLDGWDAIDFHIMYIGAALLSPKMVKVYDGVVVGFSGVVMQPSFQSWVIWGAIFVDGWCRWWRWWQGNKPAYAGEEALSRVGRVSWW